MSVIAPPKAGTPPQRLGRFELRKVLGKGAQATVWLAFDGRLEREVAVKLLRAGADTVAIDPWLHEARAVSRLSHPHIVPLFEADQHQGHPFLVFEYVQGPTLTELLRDKGALDGREAATLMLGVLDALRAAHALDIVHRDLKPSNILLDGAGRARVMDFGIAARVTDVGDGSIVGTPGYMSPEAARGAAPSALMDVFSAGMLFGELVTGRRLLREADPRRAIQRVVAEDMRLPTNAEVKVDDALRAIVMRALHRDPQQRYASAAEFHRAVSAWLAPPEALAAEPAPSGSGTLEFLLRRMRHKTDFPAMSDSVARIQRVASSENESLASLSNEILKDVALTNKLLRLVNTAHYSHAGGGTISTISRAVALIGFAGIRNMALSLVLLDHMQDKAHANQLKEEFVRALMAGSIASELASVARDSEESFIGAMFQNLGRLLTEFYFPEEALQIRQQMKPVAGKPQPLESQVSTRVLGLSFEELGVGIAKSWGLPDGLQKSMREPAGDPPAKPIERGPERVRWLGGVANDITDVMLTEGPERLPGCLSRIAARYARALGFTEAELRDAAQMAREKLKQLAQAMNLHIASGSPAHRLLTGAANPAPADAPDSLLPMQLQATLPMGAEDDTLIDGSGDAETVVMARSPEQVSALLAAGIQDITNTMVAENFKLNEVLRMILETMFRALGFRRVVFCLRDPKIETLTGRFGLGDSVEAVSKVFRVPLKLAAGQPPDLFSAICAKGADTLISDTSASNIASRLPRWYREQVNAPAFLMLPLVLKNAPFGLIYADMAEPGGLALDEKELSLLRTLRNQAVMAFRQVA